MFGVGSLVRTVAVGDSPAGDIMRVLEVTGGTVHCAIGNDDEDGYFVIDDIELVKSEMDEVISVQQELNENTMDIRTIHKQLNGYIISVIQELRDADMDGEIGITIRCRHYRGDEATITYGVELDYDREVTSDNLSKSAHVALARRRETESLEVKALPIFVDKVA